LDFRFFTREELYALVWASPMTKAAASLGLSDVGLRKICTRHDIPVPGRGYWRRLETATAVKRTLLPSRKNAPQIRIEMKIEPPPIENKDQDRLESRLAFEAASENRIVVHPGLVRLHPIAREVGSVLRKGRPDDYGCVRCVAVSLPYVRVPPGSIDRAVLVLDALLKAFDARGFPLADGKGTSWDASARVLIEGEAIEFAIEESARRQHHKPTAEELAHVKRWGYASHPLYDFTPSGILSIKRASYYGTVWKDLAKRKVEDRLNEVIVGLIKAAFDQRQRKREAEELERKRQERAARREALRRRRQEEEKAVAQLEADASAWVRARDVRAYLDQLAKSKSPKFSSADEQANWVAWARRYADWLDPLTASEPSILDLPQAAFREHSPYDLREEYLDE
jgi:hypothetical protein